MINGVSFISNANWWILICSLCNYNRNEHINVGTGCEVGAVVYLRIIALVYTRTTNLLQKFVHRQQKTLSTVRAQGDTNPNLTRNPFSRRITHLFQFSDNPVF